MGEPSFPEIVISSYDIWTGMKIPAEFLGFTFHTIVPKAEKVGCFQMIFEERKQEIAETTTRISSV